MLKGYLSINLPELWLGLVGLVVVCTVSRVKMSVTLGLGLELCCGYMRNI